MESASLTRTTALTAEPAWTPASTAPSKRRRKLDAGRNGNEISRLRARFLPKWIEIPVLVVFLFAVSLPVLAQTAETANADASSAVRLESKGVIKNLKTGDPVFDAMQDALGKNAAEFGSGYTRNHTEDIEPPVPVLYTYTVKKGETFNGVQADSGLRGDTLLSLNRLPSAAAVKPGMTLLISTVDGVFVPDNPKSELEKLLYASKEEEFDSAQELSLPNGNFYFFPNDRLNNNDWAFFKVPNGWLFPLPKVSVITSPFGYRRNPLTRRRYRQFHPGVDYRARDGTPVLASRSGVVIEVGYSKTYGKHIIIQHDNGYISLYGHLSKAEVKRGDEVYAHDEIGLSGHSGMVTGPHLHFEIRKSRYGRRVDPVLLLKKSGALRK
jgi:murein DD-endopeptidase MepM/ murein hydrolase activator NlpD